MTKAARHNTITASEVGAFSFCAQAGNSNVMTPKPPVNLARGGS
jgi:hypothetical protein